jgi:hypothetical protein
MEMRKEIRYRLDSQALFSWASVDLKRLRGEGTTRDLSVFGAFILSPTCPPVQTAIQMEIALPSLSGMKAGIRIRGIARVVRVEHSSGGVGENGFALVRPELEQWNVLACAEVSEGVSPLELIEAGTTGARNLAVHIE